MQAAEAPEEAVRKRTNGRAQDTLETTPIPSAAKLDTTIPNTPLVASIISFVLGALFAIGFIAFVNGGLKYWWLTYQLGFFVVAWSGFHWGESDRRTD